MVNEQDFYNILNRIARALENINTSLNRMEFSKKRESDQYVRESKQRMFDKKRKILNENKNRDKFIREIEAQIHKPDEVVKKILEK